MTESPPILIGDEAIESLLVPPDYAPYKDEETADYNRKLNEKDDAISELEEEIAALKSEIKDEKRIEKVEREKRKKAKEKAEKKKRKEREVDDVNEADEKGAPSSDSDDVPPDSDSKREADDEEEVTENSEGLEAGTFEATYYDAQCSTGCTGVTATGVDVSDTTTYEGKRVIAADPSVLPLGSTVEVTSPNGSFQATVQDTGGDIQGNRIDILVGSDAEARKLGRHNVEVKVID